MTANNIGQSPRRSKAPEKIQTLGDDRVLVTTKVFHRQGTAVPDEHLAARSTAACFFRAHKGSRGGGGHGPSDSAA
jgi:hypothetical protein